MLLLDDSNLNKKDFITKDGSFYFQLINHLRKKGFYSLDEVTILSNTNENVIERYKACGGWDTIQHQINIINDKNYDTYLDILCRENIIINMHNDGFNLLKAIDIDGKKIVPLTLFRKMDSESVTDWYEARLSTYNSGYSSKVIEEEEIDFDDDFIENCAEGVENGVPFDSGGRDVNNEEINCFPFLSRQINGLLEGTFTMMGGYSSTGKSTWWITIIMALLYRGKKVLIISNEETIKKFKLKFLIWLLYKRNRYYQLTKKKLMSGDISDEDRVQLADVQKYWKQNYKGRVKFISVSDANMALVKKKARENILRYGYDTILYDTFKLDFEESSDKKEHLSLIKDSRDLDSMAKKYNVIMLASLQLAIHTIGKLFLDASTLSNSKQIKENLENLFLMRIVYPEELDPENKKYYCRPFQLKKIDDKWVEEEYHADPNAVWRMVFPDKTRSGPNSGDNGCAYLLKFYGDFSVFNEVAQCRPRHGFIM